MGSVIAVANEFWPKVLTARSRLIVYVAAYVVGGYLGQWPTSAHPLTATLWIPSGLTLAILLQSDRKDWLQIAAVGYVTDFAVEHWIYNFEPVAAALVAAGNIVE